MIINKENKVLNENSLDVYIAAIPDNMEQSTVYPSDRDKFIRETKGFSKRLERYAVWRLLEIAVKHSFSLSMEEISFSENKGKWSCDKLFFSLSHTRGAVAAAVSKLPCGVDIEAMERFTRCYSDPRMLQKFQGKLRGEDENFTISNPRELIELWTKKECIYKCFGTEDYFTRKISTFAYESITKSVHLPEEYIISFCGEAISAAQIHIIDNL